MRRFIAKYLLYIYNNLIKDSDLDIFKDWAKPVIKILNSIRIFYIWIGSIIFFPIFVIGMIFGISKDSLEIKNIYSNKK